jgi:hypothetical protein
MIGMGMIGIWIEMIGIGVGIKGIGIISIRIL